MYRVGQRKERFKRAATKHAVTEEPGITKEPSMNAAVGSQAEKEPSGEEGSSDLDVVGTVCREFEGSP